MTLVAPGFKDPDDIVPYNIDVSDRIGDADRIVSFQWSSEDLTLGTAQRVGNVISVIVSGGEAPVEGYKIHTITCRVSTQFGYRFDETLAIRVRDASKKE